MDVLERGGRRLIGLALVLAACSGAPQPTALPPQTVTQAPEQPAETAPAPAEPAARSQAPDVITIEAAPAETAQKPSLVEAARRERARRERTTDQPIAVITDENLKDYATGQLTFVEGEEPDRSDDGEGAVAVEDEANNTEDPEEQKGETYWRRRVREIRVRWKAAADRVPQLEERVAALREQFYAADDAYYRDTRIKPAWDRAIDQVAQTLAEAEAHRRQLQDVLEEGRRAGALPGWLREGVELEPAPQEPPSAEHEPSEPTIYEIDDGGPGG